MDHFTGSAAATEPIPTSTVCHRCGDHGVIPADHAEGFPAVGPCRFCFGSNVKFVERLTGPRLGTYQRGAKKQMLTWSVCGDCGHACRGLQITD